MSADVTQADVLEAAKAYALTTVHYIQGHASEPAISKAFTDLEKLLALLTAAAYSEGYADARHHLGMQQTS